jgi:hypothetical protein
MRRPLTCACSGIGPGGGVSDFVYGAIRVSCIPSKAGDRDTVSEANREVVECVPPFPRGRFHRRATLRSAKYRSFVADSSLGKLPRFLMIFRSVRCRLSSCRSRAGARADRRETARSVANSAASLASSPAPTPARDSSNASPQNDATLRTLRGPSKREAESWPHFLTPTAPAEPETRSLLPGLSNCDPGVTTPDQLRRLLRDAGGAPGSPLGGGLL